MPKASKENVQVDPLEETIEIIAYTDYRKERGEIGEAGYQAIISSNPSQQDIALMESYLHQSFSAQGLSHLVNELDCEVAAKIKDALGDEVPLIEQNPNSPNHGWLLTEAYLLQGKDPDRIFAARFPNL